MNLLSQSVQSITFLTLFGAGLGYILLTAALGHVFGGHDHDVGHAHDGTGDNDHSHETVSIFSPRIIALFMVGFGATGVIATHYGLGIIVATLSGFGGGFALGGVALFGLRLLYSQQASSEVRIQDAVGLSGTVTVEIPTVGTGEIGVTVKGQYLTYSAASRGASIPRNTPVRIESAQGNYLVVTV